MIDPQLAACVHALRELILAGERYRLAAATYLGVSVTDSQALSYLLARGEMGQRELAEALSMTTGSITMLIDRLEARGLVQRTAHPTDRRRTIVRVSAAGAAALAEVSTWMTAAFDDFGPGELPGVVTTLHGLAAGLHARTSAVPNRAEDGAAAPRRRRR